MIVEVFCIEVEAAKSGSHYPETWAYACVPPQCSVKHKTHVGGTFHAAFKGKGNKTVTC